MKTSEIQPGEFYRVRLGKYQGIVQTDLVRCERIEELTERERSFGYTQKKIICTRALAKGLIEITLNPRDIITQENPTERFMRVWKVIEEEA